MGEALLDDDPDVLEARGAYLTSKGGRIPLIDDEGRKLHVTWATGYSPNSAPFKEGSCSDALNEGGFVKCDEFQRVINYERYNFFACGDVCSASRFEANERTAIGALRHTGAAASNVARIAYQWALKRGELNWLVNDECSVMNPSVRDGVEAMGSSMGFGEVLTLAHFPRR
jgi:hypothetical protein